MRQCVINYWNIPVVFDVIKWNVIQEYGIEKMIEKCDMSSDPNYLSNTRVSEIQYDIILDWYFLIDLLGIICRILKLWPIRFE